VTCTVPSLRVVVPSFELATPSAACGAPCVVSGGQALAQAPMQVLLELLSACHRYRLRPFPSTRTKPSFDLTRPTVALAELAVVTGVAVLLGCEVLALPVAAP
jgi:hypothetical protein